MQALPKGDNFMLISSKGRYTLYVLVDLAKNGQNRYIPLKEIAERQNISKKYMEGILKTLVDRNLLEGVKGKGLKSIGKQGRAILTIDNNCSIYVDAFQGYGDTYQEREETVLAFEKDGQTIKFNSFNELWEKINK